VAPQVSVRVPSNRAESAVDIMLKRLNFLITRYSIDDGVLIAMHYTESWLPNFQDNLLGPIITTYWVLSEQPIGSNHNNLLGPISKKDLG
jgi:hypothetical protein